MKKEVLEQRQKQKASEAAEGTNENEEQMETQIDSSSKPNQATDPPNPKDVKMDSQNSTPTKLQEPEIKEVPPTTPISVQPTKVEKGIKIQVGEDASKD